MEEKDKKMIVALKSISARGNNAEVECDKNGNWVIYEVHKKKKMVE